VGYVLMLTSSTRALSHSSIEELRSVMVGGVLGKSGG